MSFTPLSSDLRCCKNTHLCACIEGHCAAAVVLDHGRVAVLQGCLQGDGEAISADVRNGGKLSLQAVQVIVR